MHAKRHKIIFLTTILLTSIYILRFIIEAIHYFLYYRIINSETVTYPYLWLKPYFESILKYTSMTDVIIAIIHIPSGLAELGTIAMVYWLVYFAELAILVVFLYHTLRRFMKKIMVLMSIVIFFLLCNPTTALIISTELINVRDSISEKNSAEYVNLKNAFEQSNIKISIISSHKVRSRSSYYFEGNKGEDYEITLRIMDVPHEVNRFTLTFNEEKFDEYQIYRENMNNGTSWLINATRSNNTFEFRDKTIGQLLNNGNQNELKFLIGIEMKKPIVYSIKISPRIDIKFDDPFDYTNEYTGSLYLPVDLEKHNYPALRLK